MGRRCRVALVMGVLVLGACSAVDDLGGELGEAAPPTSGAPAPTPGGPPTTAPRGGAGAPAGPVHEIELTRGQAGTVEVDDGARLSLPAGSVLAERARLRLARAGPGAYEPTVVGEWQGRAELRVPVGPVGPRASAFLLVRSGTGWAVQEAETRPDGFLYADLASLAPARSLTCPATVALDPAGVLACLAQAGVSQLPGGQQAQLASALGCGGAWPTTALLSREAACAVAPPQHAVSPSSEPPSPVSEGHTGGPSSAEPSQPLQVVLTEEPVACNGSRRPFGFVSGAFPGETLSFYAAGIGELLPGTADGAGVVTAHWRCDPPDAGRSWSLTATGLSSGRTVSFSLTGGPAG